MAEGRERANQILAFYAARKHHAAVPGVLRKVALAHRARLPGTQAGGWAWSLRGPPMARLPSSCHAVHRSLRIPDLRAGDDSPLSNAFHQAALAACHSQRLPT